MNKNKRKTIILENFMVEKLKLTGNDLILYALIYSFSKDGIGEFFASKEYVANRLGISISSVYKIMGSLLSRRLIIRNGSSENRKLPSYRVNLSVIEGKKEKSEEREEFEHCYGAYGRFEKVNLTFSQYEDLIQKLGYNDTDFYIQRLECLIISQQVEYNPNHYSAILKMAKEHGKL